MYPISNSVAALFEAENAQVLRITGTDKNGAVISITDADVLIDGFNVDRYSCNGEKLEVGTAIAAEMELKLNNASGAFDGIVFEGAELFVEIGVADWSQDNPTVSYIPIGYFTPDEQPRKLTTITLKALDRMMRFDAVPPTLTPWTTDTGAVMEDGRGNIIYFVAELVFPCTVAQLVRQVAVRCNVPFTQSLMSLPNYNYTITALPTLQQDITFRNIIQWCAGIMGTCAFIDWNGELCFKWYSAADYTSTMEKRFRSDLYENDITVTGVQYTNTQDAVIVSGSADYALDMTGNYLAATGIAQILPAIGNVVNGFTYRAFEASVISAPWLWPMDVITFTDKNGIDHSCAVTNVNFGLNGSTALAGKGETTQANSGTKPSGVTTEQAFLIEKATVYAADKAIDNMSQEQVFNVLTNNGELQGLLLYDGKVYLNASYINTGTLSADRIKGGTLTLGGNNNANGIINMLNNNGNSIGTWGRTGLIVTEGQFDIGSSETGGFHVSNQGELAIGPKPPSMSSYANNKCWFQVLRTGQMKAKSIDVYSAEGDEDLSYYGAVYGVYSDNHGKGIIIRSATTVNASLHVWDDCVETNGKLNVFNGEKVYGGIEANGGITVYNGAIINGTTTFNNSINVLKGRSKFADVVYVPAGIDFSDPANASTVYYGYIVGTSSAYYSSGNRGLDFHSHASTVMMSLCSDGVYVYNLKGKGTKSRVVSTDQYSDRLLYCYETPTPTFGDIGEGVIGEDGKCYVWLDPVFAQTVTVDQYQVFLQRYGPGDCYVSQRRPGCFVVEGDPGLAFGWEIKAKQRDYDQLRLDKNEGLFSVKEQTYGEDAAKYLQDLQKGRIEA